jgi:hypothetical protein
VGAEFCAAAAGIAQINRTKAAIGKHNLAEIIARLIGFFLYGMNVRGNLTIFCALARGESGYANLRISGLHDANREIGVPGIAAKQS